MKSTQFEAKMVQLGRISRAEFLYAHKKLSVNKGVYFS